ncbi:MAG: XisI protein [Gemmataceae bacterium]
MDTLSTFRDIIEQVLQPFADIRYAYGDIKNEVVLNRVRDRYLVISQGWDGKKRVHSPLLHIDIIGEKVWIQWDGTEEGIAPQLMAAGIPKDKIVLGFYAPEVRPFTDFAVA